MKTQFFSAIAISFLMVSCVNVKSDGENIGNIFTGRKGTGSITEKSFSGDFDAIQVSTSISADIIKSDA